MNANFSLDASLHKGGLGAHATIQAMYSVFAASPLAVQVVRPHLKVLGLASCMTLEICKSYEKAALLSSLDWVNANVMADDFR